MSEFLGVNVSIVNLVGDQKFPLGTRFRDPIGKEYMYVKAGGTIAVKNNITVATGFVGSALAGAGIIDGISGVAAVINEFLWIQVSGLFSGANVATGLAANVIVPFAADANGDFQPIAAAQSVTIAGVRGRTLTAESGGFGDVYLYSN